MLGHDDVDSKWKKKTDRKMHGKTPHAKWHAGILYFIRNTSLRRLCIWFLCTFCQTFRRSPLRRFDKMNRNDNRYTYELPSRSWLSNWMWCASALRAAHNAFCHGDALHSFLDAIIICSRHRRCWLAAAKTLARPRPRHISTRCVRCLDLHFRTGHNVFWLILFVHHHSKQSRPTSLRPILRSRTPWQ